MMLMRALLTHGQLYRIASIAGPLVVLLLLIILIIKFSVPLWITKLPLIMLAIVSLGGLFIIIINEQMRSSIRPSPLEVFFWAVKVLFIGSISLAVARIYAQASFDPFSLLAFAIAVAAVSGFPKGEEVPDLYSKVDENNLDSVSAHEAGHAMAFALLADGLPNDFEAHALPIGNIGGMVRGAVYTQNHYEQGLRWMMLLRVAGIAGERIIGNENVYGTERDLIEWESQARTYHLLYGTRRTPLISDSLTDAATRAEVFYNLLEENIEDMVEFIQSNREVFDILRKEIAQKKVVRVRRALCLLSQVKFTDRCQPVKVNYSYGFAQWPSEGLHCRREQ